MKADPAKETVLITGASGFIGHAAVRAFADRFNVIGLDLHTPLEKKAEARLIEMDIASEESVRGALAQVRTIAGLHIASVIHLAAYFDLTGEPNPKYEEITVNGTKRLLSGLQAFDVKQFVYASTMLVHAPSKPGQRIDEDWPLDPKLPYQASKVRTEKLVREMNEDIPAVLIRPAGVYDDMCHAAFLAHQIARIYERKLISHVYPGDPATGQPFLHLDDLTDALVRIVERRRSLPHEAAFLLGETDTPGFQQLQNDIGCLIYGEQWETRQVPKPLARTGAWLEEEVLDKDVFIKPWMIDTSDDHYELDISRARTLLGWEPERSLRDTLPKMIAALKADPVGWYETNKLNAAQVAGRQPDPPSDGREIHEDRGAITEHMAEMRRMHFSMLWVHFLNIMLGLWLAGSAFVFGLFDQQVFSDSVLQVTAERNLWDPAVRMTLLGWSDVISGLLITFFGALSLNPRFSRAQWANTVVGIWLLFAPLIFWSPSAAVYANDTIVGALVIAFAILVPMMPGMSHQAMMDQSDMPPGWSYNPSTYLQRIPIIALGFCGFIIARYLAAYQLGHIDGIRDPFFSGQNGKNGTEYIITSHVSKAWPVADAGLGAVGYMFEVLMGVMGDRRRWRTMPWMVAMFGVVVVPLGVVSIYFIIIQPIVLGTWCALCLLAALAMLVMIPYTLDELVAMVQFMAQSLRRGRPFWHVFFVGAPSPAGGRDDSPGFGASFPAMIVSATRGVNLPWTLAVTSAIGIWLMFTQPVFGTVPPMADSDHLAGALIVTVSVMAMAEVARPLRFINILFGLWLVAAPWFLTGASLAASLAGVAAGIAVIALSLPRGRRSSEHYGSWDYYII